MRFKIVGKIGDSDVDFEISDGQYMPMNGYYRVLVTNGEGRLPGEGWAYVNNKVYLFPIDSVIIHHDQHETPGPSR